MNNSSDNKLPQYRINELLGSEVFDSPFTQSLYGTSFDRILSRDNTQRVAGYIGTHNEIAVGVDRQLQEQTPYRQLNQLQPIATTIEGEQTKLLSFPRFLDMLSLMGVDTERFADWGFTTSFNWAPPVNLDKLINYQDYYWVGEPGDRPQYAVIEDRCLSAQMKLDAYDQLLNGFETTFSVLDIDIENNTMTMNGAMTQIFVPGFQFFTTSDLAAFNNRFWTVVDSKFIPDTGTTVIVLEPIAVKSETPPHDPVVNMLWFNTVTKVLYTFDGAEWQYVAPTYTVIVSLEEMRGVYQTQVNCACHGDQGWDINQWDDNQRGTVLWNEEILAKISWPNETDWNTANPTGHDRDSLWYDTTNNKLNAWSVQRDTWVPINHDFESVIARTEGKSLWDSTIGCEIIEGNDWTRNNKWRHKTQLATFSNAVQAQLPILEYSAAVDFNTWLKISRSWKYRPSAVHAFEHTDKQPSRLELEPIKGYVADTAGQEWILYLMDPLVDGSLPINYTDTFVPGFKFQITNDLGDLSTYTVKYSQYRNLNYRTDSEMILERIGTERLVTVVVLTTTDFTSSPTVSQYNDRIIPFATSMGDSWMGYQINWLLDIDSINYSPSSKPMVNQELTDVSSPIIRQLTGIGTLTVYKSAQELSVYTPQTIINIDSTLWYDSSSSGPYATPSTINVYVNGKQLGTNEYTLQLSTGTIGYTAIGPTVNPGYQIEYVSAVVLNESTTDGDMVRIEVGVSAFNDLGLVSVPVRTVEDEAEFTEGVLNRTQPQYMSLNQYTKFAQSKVEDNQYPLFNVYDIITNEVVQANPVFVFDENEEMSINVNTNKRIVRTPDNGDFNFKQLLLKESNGEIFAYRDIRAVAPRTYWYSGSTNKLMFWYEDAWNDVIIDVDNKLVSHTRPIISTDEPQPAVRNSYWYNPSSNELVKRVGNRWILQSRPIVNTTDPSLFTIWRTSVPPMQYVPSKIDNSTEWNLADSWFYNPSHDNWQFVKYTELITHFNSIMGLQQKVPGLPQGGGFTLTQDQLNLGVGGNIKEYNYNLDNLISAINVDYVTPIQVIEFAKTQYQELLDRLRSSCLELLPTLIATTPVTNLEMKLDDTLMKSIKDDNFMAGVYYDTTSYDTAASKGVPNWIMTLPIMGLVRANDPVLFKYKGQYEIKHHDGHIGALSLSVTDRLSIVQQIIQTQGPTGKPIGVIRRESPAASVMSFNEMFKVDELFIGAIWYDGRLGKLYKFEPVTISDRAPATTYPVGSTYYNTATNVAYELRGTQWVPTAQEGSRSIIKCWKEIDLLQLIGAGIIGIERRLFERADQLWNGRALIDSTVYQNVAESDNEVRNKHMQDRFNVFYSDKGRINPSLNQQYVTTDAFTWNYSKSIASEYPSAKRLSTIPAYWKEIYRELYGTAQPHLEPWVLQGYHNKPEWWDEEYLNIDSTQYYGRRWKSTYNIQTNVGSGMWENIRTGFIPHGRIKPSGTVSVPGDERVPFTYAYFSVNISDELLAERFAPDDILPPYFNIGDTNRLTQARSIFTDFNNQIIGPNSDYAIQTGSPFEWDWMQSIDFQYDKIIAQFLTQPMRTMHALVGRLYTDVGGLLVDIETKRVASHKRTSFHGDIHNGRVYRNNGILQWYADYNRFGNYDSGREFHQRWAKWTPTLSYMTASTNDTTQTQIYNKLFDITERDYSFKFANTSLLSSSAVDTFKLRVIDFPPQSNAYDNDNEWVVELALNRDVVDTIEYYDVDVLPFIIINGQGKLNQYRIKSVDKSASIIMIEGNVEHLFVPQQRLEVTESPHNNGMYTIVACSYDSDSDSTRISVSEILRGSIGLGFVSDPEFISNFQPGDLVHIHATKFQPGNIQRNRTYFYRMIDDVTFEISESYRGSLDGELMVDITQPSTGHLTIGRVDTSFQVYGGATGGDKIWYHYKTNDTKRQVTLPRVIRGLQNVINVIDGYSKLLTKDRQVSFDGTIVTFDDFTGRSNGWQLEIENMIIYALITRSHSNNVESKYPIYISPTDLSLFHYRAKWPTFKDGARVNVVSTSLLPYPLDSRTAYYYKQVESGFKLYTNSLFDPASLVEVSDHSYTGALFIQHAVDITESFIATEINPNREYVKIQTPKGIVSNIFEGPSVNTKTNLLVFDQNGNRLTSADVLTYRQDENTIIHYTGEDRDTRHIAGATIYVEGYEHVVQFNDYTVGGVLMYDAFLGTRTQRLEVDFYREPESKLRPTIGGYYMLGGEIHRNFEGHADDLRDMYDWYKQRSFSQLSQYAYNLVGYRPSKALNMIDVGDKSQILFYQGMIKQKGTENALTAYVNSRYYSNVDVDEFWAIKLGNFGTTEVKQFPDIRLMSDDNHSSTIKVVSLDQGLNETVDNIGFNTSDSVVVSFGTNVDRWVDYPIVRQQYDSPVLMHAKSSVQEFNASDVRTVNGKFYLRISPQDEITVRTDVGITATAINSSYIQLSAKPSGNITVVGSRLDVDRHDPIKLMDSLNVRTSHTIPFWHPAYGVGDYLATANVDLIKSDDPAIYNDGQMAVSPSSYWSWVEVGKRWIDTSTLGFRPYYDQKIYPESGDRFKIWGKQADWTDVNAYEWVESATVPEKYTGSGIPRQLLVQKVRTNIVVTGNGTSIIPVTAGWITDNGVVENTLVTIITSDGDTIPTNVLSISPFKLTYQNEDEEVELVDGIQYTLAPSFDGLYWKVPSYANVELVGAMLTANGQFTLSAEFKVGNTVGVYVNGVYQGAEEILPGRKLELSMYQIRSMDIVELRTSPYIPTDADLEFDPVTADDGRAVIWSYITPYVSAIAPNQKMRYYFWVSGIESPSVDDRISIAEATRRFNWIAYPYFTVDYPKATSLGDIRYRRLMIHNAKNIIGGDNRYILRVTNNGTQRDDINVPAQHEQWKLIRRKQETKIDKPLWDKLVESLIGRQLNTDARLPSLELTLWDQDHGSTTRYGLGSRQVMAERRVLIDTILGYLMSPTSDLYPIDVEGFLRTSDFETTDGIIEAMHVIYETFSVAAVNALWFECLADSLAVNPKYEGLMKTSWVALSGEQKLNVNGMLED